MPSEQVMPDIPAQSLYEDSVNATVSISYGDFYNSTASKLYVPSGTSCSAALKNIKVSGTVTRYGYNQGQATYVGSASFSATITSTSTVVSVYGGTLTISFVNSTFVGGHKNVVLTLVYAGQYNNKTQTLSVTIYEEPPQSIVLSNANLNYDFADTISLTGATLTVYYSNSNVALTGSSLTSYLTANNAVITYKGNTYSFTTDLDENHTEFLVDELVVMNYTLENGGSFAHKFAVSYHDHFTVSANASEVGSVDNWILVDINGITIAKTTFVANVKTHTNTCSNNGLSFNSVVTNTNVTSSAVWSKDEYTYDEVDEMGGVPDNISITYTDDDSRDFEAFLTVYLKTKTPTIVEVNGSDSTARYYNGEDSYFKEPIFTFEDDDNPFIFYYEDGTSAYVSALDIADIEYKLHDDDEEDALIEDEDIIPPSATQLYVHIILVNGEEYYAPYDIYRMDDEVDSIICAPDFTFVLGNYLEKYKGNSIQVTAIWKNEAKENTTNFTDFTFDDESMIMTNADLGVSTTIHIGSDQFTIDLTDVSYSNPAVESVDIVVSQGIKRSYQNLIEKINLSLVKLLVHYEDSAYTREVTFNSNNVADDDEFGVKVYDKGHSQYILTQTNDLNGTNDLNMSPDDAMYDCQFEFQIKNEFTANTDTELEVPFLIVTIQEITGIRVLETYRDYKVGDTFLNDDDTTLVRLFYPAVDSFGTEYTASTDVLLKDNLPTVSTNYAKGTEWTQPDNSKRIVISSVFNSNVTAEYTIEVTYDGYVTGSKSHDLVVIWQPSLVLPDGTLFTEDNGVLVIYDEEDTTTDYISGYHESDGTRILKQDRVGTAKPKGYIRNIFNTKVLDSQAVMVLFEDYKPPIESSPNVTINFPCYLGLADNINKCQFGILFGNNNANNRLFVSGNPNIRNADWHSGETNTVHSEGEVENINGDFSYFPNEYVMYYGETDNKVIGYDIVANDKLFVIKDKSDKEKTVYFRTPTMVTSLSATGASSKDIQEDTLYQEEFALVKGNNSVAGISPHAIVNLNGDTLFIDDDNTVQGLDLTGIVGDNQRYANTRSAYLDGLLKTLDLKDSFLWTNNKYLFMPVKDVGLFVTHAKTKNSDNNQYEWWKIQSENATCFAEIDNTVYFGNGKGELFQMRNGKYEDEYKIFVSEGNGLVSLDEENEKMVVSQSVFNAMYPDGIIDEERRLFFHSVNNSTTYRGSIFQQIGSINNDSTAKNVDLLIIEDDGVYYLEVVGKINGVMDLDRQAELMLMLKENQTYYLNYYVEEGTQEVKCDPTSLFYRNYYNKFRLEYIGGYDRDRYLMKIWNNSSQTWDDIDLADLYRANLVQMLDGEYKITDANATTCSFQLLDESNNVMNLVYYADQPTSIPLFGEIIEKKNVVAYYVTAPFTMGNIDYFKTIWSFTFTNDTGKPSEYDLAIASNKIPYVDTQDICKVSKAKIGTNFWDFTFEAVDFDKNVVPRTYTIKRTLGMQKFVCFAFKNGNNSNAILSSLSVVYTLPFPSYGSD